MNGDRRTLHLVRPDSEGDAPPGTTHPLPGPMAPPEEWNRVLDLIFEHDVAVIW